MSPDSDSSSEDDADKDSITGLGERSFEALEDEVDRRAAKEQLNADAAKRIHLAEHATIRSEADFEAAVRTAVDELPDDVQAKLRDIAITVSDDGHVEHAYGMFVPGARPDDGYRWWFFSVFAGGRRADPSQIIIYRDTLMRDFGRDPDLLRAKITETVRHEVGHALGFDEAGVRGLGL
jgi:predicted Zn-dependent protease with MMP-like domain